VLSETGELADDVRQRPENWENKINPNDNLNAFSMPDSSFEVEVEVEFYLVAMLN
jgi:hypothetical protein